jgi:hypothetical protein
MQEVLFTRSTYQVLRISLLLLLGLALLGTAVYAQETASITGTVTDASGAVVPNAKVTITSQDTGLARDLTTNAAGAYSAPQLAVGKYTVLVEVPGFKTYEQKDIGLETGAEVRVDAQLAVGQPIEHVVVESSVVQVQAETNDVSQTISASEVADLATNGRNIIQLAALVPGAASGLPDFDTPMAQTQNRDIVYNGQRSDHNNWIINGGEAYDRGGGGIMLVSPSQDSIQEFKVETSNFAADLGQSSGGMIVMSTKSGTKDFHGGLWEYIRNDDLDANTWVGNHSIVNGAASPKPELRYNTFGFNFGGPVPIGKQKKTFFFYNMEWRRRINGGQTNDTNPIPRSQLAGVFTSAISIPNTTDPGLQNLLIAALPASSIPTAWGGSCTGSCTFPNNTIPSSLLNKDVQTLLSAGMFPGANTASGTYVVNTNQITMYREETARLDHQFGDKLSLMASLIYDNGAETDYPPLWAGGSYATAGSTMAVPSWAGVVHATWTISPTLLNEAAFNLNGNNLNITDQGLWQGPSGYTTPSLFGANTDNKLPGIAIGFPYLKSYTSGWWPWFNTWRSWQGKDDLSWVHGKHNLKFGFSYMFTHKWQQYQTNAGGQFGFGGGATGNSVADFDLGLASSGLPGWLGGGCTGFCDPLHVGFVDISNNTFSSYAMDDWRVTSRLTLNLGVRWEGIPHAYDSNNNASNFYPNLYSAANAAQFLPGQDVLNTHGPGFVSNVGPIQNFPFYMNGIGIAGQGGVPSGLVNNSWDTFAPRVGFAYDLTGRQKTIVRAGAGMFYERLGGNEMYNLIQNSVPYAYTSNLEDVYFSNPTKSWATGLTATSPYGPDSIWMLDKGYKVPTSLQWSFGIQQQLAQNAVLSVAYVGNSNFHQTEGINVNTLNPSDTTDRTAVCGSTCGYTGAPVIADYYRPYYGWGGITDQVMGANSNYNSLQVSFRVTEWKHLTISEAYTWSHALDIIDGELFAAVNNPFNTKWDYASAGFDRRNISITSFIYKIPFFNSATGLTKTVLGGWELSGILTLENGNPISVGTTADNLGFGGGTNNRMNLISAVTYPKTIAEWFSTNSFAEPAALQWGTESRDAIVGPGRNNWNIALFKAFQFTERAKVEFRAETFNTFNHPNFTNPDTTFTDKTFGQLTGTFDPRIWQFGAKFVF